MINLKKYEQVFFDCDGVILDSNGIKSEAFEKSLYGESAELIQEFISYHKANGGISRFVKFKYFFTEIKNQKDCKDRLNETLEKYSKLSLDGLLLSEEVKGVRDFLKLLKSLGIDCFVVSGGEEGEVRKVLKIRGFNQYFKGIYGSPKNKQEHLLRLEPTSALYFGDAKSDYVAAMQFGMDFVYVSNYSDWSNGKAFCRSKGIKVIEDFSHLT